MGSTQLLYEPPETPGDRDLLRELIPDYPSSPDKKGHERFTFLETVDPRLWAVLIQVYAGLPETLRTYDLPLADRHLPLLQQIPSTSDFSLVTIVELRACPDLNDQSIIRLRDLHSLGALDISETKVTSWGIKSFAKTMVKNDSYASSDIRHLAGPWKLRILSLHSCKQIDDGVFEGLRRFPLLSVIDLRGTRCTPSSNKGSSFASSTDRKLFYPTPLQSSLDTLYETFHISHRQRNYDASQPRPQLFSHDPTFYLHVQTQYYKEKTRRHASSSHSARSSLMPIAPEAPPTGMLGHVASVEARQHASSASVLSFYAAPAPRRNEPSADNMTPATAHWGSSDKLDSRASNILSSPLTLYRPPPPWQTLLSPPSTAVTHKRPRPSTDDSLPAPKRAKGAVEGLLSRDGAIMIRSEFQKDREERKKAAPKPNPFKKGMPVSVFEEERRKGVSANAAAASRMAKPTFGTIISTTSRPTIPASTSTTRAKAPAAKTTTPLSTVTVASRTTDRTKPKTLAEKFPDNLCQPSILPIPPRPKVPLFPISSLPIPQLPPEILAKLRAEAAASKGKGKMPAVSPPTVQTKLSDFVKRKPTSNSAASASAARGSSSSAQTSAGERLKSKPGKPIPTERRSASSSIQKGQAGGTTNSLWPKSRSAGPVAPSSKAGRRASGAPSTKTGS
ncbi:hypothetical protein EIP86_004094 [Pleurotus ostreatoroseus]|nr:hypothetical protein EIP86_004094 [Pleurotus ostreatoroseus]